MYDHEQIADLMDQHDLVICEGIANGIVGWIFQASPLRADLDSLIDRLTYELDSRIIGFDAKPFKNHILRESGIE